MKATIKEAKLQHIDAVWKKHKPQGLGFSDTDMITLDLKTAQGKTHTETFYCRLKADGTIGHSMTHASEKRQKSLIKFIKKYISQEKRYNVRDNIKKWKEKQVEVEEVDGEILIKL